VRLDLPRIRAGSKFRAQPLQLVLILSGAWRRGLLTDPRQAAVAAVASLEGASSGNRSLHNYVEPQTSVSSNAGTKMTGLGLDLLWCVLTVRLLQAEPAHRHNTPVQSPTNRVISGQVLSRGPFGRPRRVGRGTVWGG
jgi:hypothetical protein